MRWLERLPPSSAARCRALFTAHADFSDITPTQYEAAYAWLGDNSLLDRLRSPVPAERRIFDCAITHGSASWFADADMLVRGPDELPADALRAARALGLTDDEAFARLQAVWGRVDTAERERVGAAGELALVQLLAGAVNERVEHVAAVSDGYGYDIAVHRREVPVHLEVKSTTRRSRLTVYLSRNEFEAMCRDPGWQLVAVRLTVGLEAVAVATVPRDWIAGQVPADRGPLGRWESCRLEVPVDVPEPGIPVLLASLKADAPALLAAATAWPG
ncbi:DUF3883 domain-containing protein [Kitasatospora sp. NPDC028055]|uniref:DUF3883 domain-containing protein n=1 Tax=Kitasatospora sp. NPDC028055 TaxID=3155653 RepID=UPI0033F641E8